MNITEKYHYQSTWSEEDNEYVATCLEFPNLSHLAETKEEALSGIHCLVADVVKDMSANGETLPVPKE